MPSPPRTSGWRRVVPRWPGTAAVLSAIEARFGVEAHVVTAVWGLESFFGERRGTVPVISALSTLAYEGRRGAFFESQLIAALKILQNGDVAPQSHDRKLGRRDGPYPVHPDLVPCLCRRFPRRRPARHLVRRSDRRAGLDRRLSQPLRLDPRPALGGRGATAGGLRRSVRPRHHADPGGLAALGVRDMDGRPVPDHGAASILRPGGGGPAFMVFRNFTVITRYNNAESYVIGVGHLSDRLRGGRKLRASSAPTPTGMTWRDRQAAAAPADRRRLRYRRRRRGGRRRRPAPRSGLSARAAGCRSPASRRRRCCDG